MTHLRTKMLEDMRLRNFSPTTAKSYVCCVAVFARFFGASQDKLGTDEVRKFLLYLEDLERAPATRAVYHAAICFLYVHTLGRRSLPAGANGRPAKGPA